MSFFSVRNINSDNTLQRSMYDVKNNLLSTKVLTNVDSLDYNVSNNTFYTSNFPTNFDWSALGSGLSGGIPITYCSSLAIDSKGNVYIGGKFTTAGGVTANNIVRWDGSNWYPLGTGLDSVCNSIAIDSNDNVYVGGTFTSTFGGTPGTLNRIAKWSPSTGVWSALYTGLDTGLSVSCQSIAIDSNNNVYACGNFTTAGTVTVNNIAKWNPSTGIWSALGAGLSGGFNTCLSISIDLNDNVYAGGAFITADSIIVNNIAKWSPSTGIWSDLGSGLNNICRSIAIDSNNNIYTCGQFTSTFGGTAGTLNRIAKWNPSTGIWSALGSGLNNICLSIAIDSNDIVYVGGEFTDAGGTSVNSIAKWNPSTDVWYALGSGLSVSCQSIAIDSNNNVYTGGQFTNAGGTSASHIAYYSNQTYINLIYNSRKLKTIRGPADSTLVFVNSDINKAFNIDINNLG